MSATDTVKIVESSPAIVQVLDNRTQVVQIVERGPQGPAGPVADQDLILSAVDEAVGDYFILHPQSFDYVQSNPAVKWTIVHPLDHLPQLSVLDTAGSALEGVESWPASNIVVVEFNVPVAGTATLS